MLYRYAVPIPLDNGKIEVVLLEQALDKLNKSIEKAKYDYKGKITDMNIKFSFSEYDSSKGFGIGYSIDIEK